MSDSSPTQLHIAELAQDLAKIRAELETAYTGQIEDTIDPLYLSTILLDQAQEAIQKTDRSQSRFLLQTSIIIFELESDGTILYVNQAVFELLGYSLKELKGKNWWATLCPEISTAEVEALTTLLHKSDISDIELTLSGKDGASIIFELSTTNRYEEDGALRRIVGLGIDVTKHRRIENDLRSRSDALEKTVAERTAKLINASSLLQEVSQEHQHVLDRGKAAYAEVDTLTQVQLKYLAMISHELRTPLTSIIGFASTLLAEDVNWDNKTEREFITIIYDEANKLTKLIEQVIDLSRLTAGTFYLYTNPTSVHEILSLIQPQILRLTNQHSLHIEIPVDLPNIMADPQRIGQVFLNLIDNAVKFSPPDSSITISADVRSPFIEFQIHDQGSGIPLENRERVFDAFLALEEIKSVNSKGAGLGLALCKGIVEAHVGKIWIDHHSSPGTTICFTVPIAVVSMIRLQNL